MTHQELRPDCHPRRQLLNLATNGRSVVTEERSHWRFGDLDKNARHSAVLILFGMLDDVPATSTGAYAVSGEAGVDGRARTNGSLDEPHDGPGRDLDILLVRRSETLRAHPGQVAFPGGRLDPPDGDLDELMDTPSGPSSAAHIRAALREAQEETGLDPDGVEILGAMDPVPLPVSNHLVVPVIGWWRRQSPVDVVDHRESSLVFRAPVLDLVNPANRFWATVERDGVTHKSPGFDVPIPETGEDITVWGFTGIILDLILDWLGWAEEWDRTRKRPAPGFAPRDIAPRDTARRD